MSVMEGKPTRTRPSLADEFKRDAVVMVLDDDNKSVDVAERLGAGEGTLGNWVRQARVEPPRVWCTPLSLRGCVDAKQVRRRDPREGGASGGRSSGRVSERVESNHGGVVPVGDDR